MLFSDIVSWLDAYMLSGMHERDTTLRSSWHALLSTCLDTIAAMLEDVLRATAVANGTASKADTALAASAQPAALISQLQAAELSNTLVQLIGHVHRCSCWGTLYGWKGNQSAATPAAINTSTANAVSVLRSAHPPAASPGVPAASIAASPDQSGGWLGLGGLLQQSDSWAQVQAAAESRVQAQSQAVEETERQQYQSRVRGPRPSKPSAVNQAIALSRSTQQAPSPVSPLQPQRPSVVSDNAAHLPRPHSPAIGGGGRRHSGAPLNALSAAQLLLQQQQVLSEQIRLHALQALLQLARLSPRLLHQHAWSTLIPISSRDAISPRPVAATSSGSSGSSGFVGPGGATLITFLLHDPSPKLRGIAAQVLAAVILDSPLTHWTAVDATMSEEPAKAKGKKKGAASDTGMSGSAFTSSSARSAETLRGLHAGLLEGLRREMSPAVIQHCSSAWPHSCSTRPTRVRAPAATRRQQQHPW